LTYGSTWFSQEFTYTAICSCLLLHSHRSLSSGLKCYQSTATSSLFSVYSCATNINIYFIAAISITLTASPYNHTTIILPPSASLQISGTACHVNSFYLSCLALTRSRFPCWPIITLMQNTLLKFV